MFAFHYAFNVVGPVYVPRVLLSQSGESLSAAIPVAIAGHAIHIANMLTMLNFFIRSFSFQFSFVIFLQTLPVAFGATPPQAGNFWFSPVGECGVSRRGVTLPVPWFVETRTWDGLNLYLVYSYPYTNKNHQFKIKKAVGGSRLYSEK